MRRSVINRKPVIRAAEDVLSGVLLQKTELLMRLPRGPERTDFRSEAGVIHCRPPYHMLVGDADN